MTLDKDGMALADRGGRREVFPTRPRQVYDITGAGDMVLSVLGLALAAGADYGDAIRLANVAGGLEVEKIGVATVSRDEILADLGGPVPGVTTLNKVLSVDWPSSSPYMMGVGGTGVVTIGAPTGEVSSSTERFPAVPLK